jgi:transcriptional regulator with XRE-family HTH domain
MKLSEIVKKYREEHGLSLRAFAERVGVSHNAIANIENERNSHGNPFVPTMETLIGIASAMGISLNDLLHMMGDEDVFVTETDELRDMLKDNPDMRWMLSTTSKFDKDDFDAVVNLIKSINRRYED